MRFGNKFCWQLIETISCWIEVASGKTMKADLVEQVEQAIAAAGSEAIGLKHVELAIAEAPLSRIFPLELYALVSFLKHERRQQWVKFIVESRLNGQGSELGQLGAFGHPDKIPQTGTVPGEEGWSYYFHGRGCCLDHKDGTTIDVDFADDGNALEIDAYFYSDYLESCPDLDWCEQQLKGTPVLNQAWEVVLPSLCAAGLITKEHRFRLTGAGRELGNALEPLLDCIDSASGHELCYLLVRLGDYISAQEASEILGIRIATLTDASCRQKEDRIITLRRLALGGQKNYNALAALALLAGETAYSELRAALLKEPVSGLNHTALMALCHINGNKILETLDEALRRLTNASWGSRIRSWMKGPASADRDLSWASLVVKIVEALLERMPANAMTEARRRFISLQLLRNKKACDDEAGFLLLLLDWNAGISKLGSCLTSPIPSPRMGAAAFLAMVGDDHCLDRLIAAAEGPVERGGHEAACALSCLDHPKAKSAVFQWLRRNDGYEDAEAHEFEFRGKIIQTWTIEDIMKSNLREHVRYDFEQKQKKYMPLLRKWRG